ncbi:MAG: family 78 glycoside hydrolase catalytic domain, partial [Spongiibacteraceae bacterium]|nr:family 78 glycoside hydrolase catalytic domain [Spongiibacteraceae bacterium]
DGLATVNIYRLGYHPGDSAHKALAKIDIPITLINNANKFDTHTLYLDCTISRFTLFVNGKKPENQIVKELAVNPVGPTHDFIGFPMVADIGFSVEKQQRARFSQLKINHYRAPSNTLFEEDLNHSPYQGVFAHFVADKNAGFTVESSAYSLNGGSDGTLVLANPSRNSMPMLRSQFTSANKEISSARLYVTARGIYEIYINGKRLANDYFNPGLTQYNVTHMYQTYDVTNMINPGKDNAIGAMLGEGWWSGYITYDAKNWNYFGDTQSLLAKLLIRYTDGSEDSIITSSKTWTYFNDGPVVYSSFFQGEVYDATKEAAVAGWSTAAYEAKAWKTAQTVSLANTSYLSKPLDYSKLSLVGQIGNNVTSNTLLSAKSMKEVRPGVYLYDMGQNMVGVAKVAISGGNAGDKITLRYAEVTYPEQKESGDNVGMIMLENIRAALAQDTYLLKGGYEIIQPKFTFHGFRYIEITGITEPLPLDAVQGVVISSITELASYYESSNKLVNKLWENITWSMRANFLSIPTDTPARNERMGWGGDISVFAQAATYLADVGPFLRRHMLAMRDTQAEDGRFPDVAPVGGGFGGTIWGSAGIIVAWEAYQQYNDIGLLAEHYDAMKRYVNYLDTKIAPDSGLLLEGPLGDWLSPEGSKNDNTLLWSAYHIRDLEILAKTAELLGESAEAKDFWTRYNTRKGHFNKTYIDPQTHKTIKSGFKTERKMPPAEELARKKAMEDGELTKALPPETGTVIDTQASYAVPLGFGVFNEENTVFAAKHLAKTITRKNQDDAGMMRPEYSLMTGFIGTASISHALSDNGRDGLAYRLLQQTSYPSWLYPVVNGATTIWERLDSYTQERGFGGNNSMNSFNHYSFGAVSAWLTNYSLGITRDTSAPGFKKFILQPTPDPDGAMRWVKGHYDSPYGKIKSAWKLEGELLMYSASVPANTTATLYLPALSAEHVLESNRPTTDVEGLNFITYEAGKAVYTLQSGDYVFSAKR